MRRPLGVRPFTGLLILVGGLLLFGGCRTLGPGEDVPVSQILPGGFPLYFSLNIADGGEAVAEILEEQDQPGIIVKTWQKGVRLWGALPARDEGAAVFVFEGDVPRLKSSLGLTFSREWKKNREGNWWEDSQGGQIAFSGGNRLFYSRGGMEKLRSREENPFSPEAGGAVSLETGRVLSEGSAVLLGEGSGVLSAFLPVPPGVNLTRWILRMDRNGQEWRGGLTLIFEREEQARFAGTTLKFLFLGSAGTTGDDQSEPGWTTLFSQRLKQTRVSRREAELILSEMVFTNPEFSGIIKEVIRRGLVFPQP